MMKSRWFHLTLIIIFTFLVGYRAYVIPFTHDESSTWLNFRHYFLPDCISDYFCWQTANNHWLNSLFLQWSANLFGESPFALRLPNVIAGLLYFSAASLLAIRYVNQTVLQLVAFLLLSAHLYLLDFFSLARGYGLMACGILWAIYAFMRYLEKEDLKWLILCVGSLMFAVLSNFTALLAFVSMAGVWLAWELYQQKFGLVLRHGLVWFAGGILLFILIYYPIRILLGSGEFDWGEDSLTDTLNDLLRNLLYGYFPFGRGSRAVLQWILLGGLLLSATAVIMKRSNSSRQQLMCALLLLGFNFFGIVLLQYITGSHTPVGRKSIYLIPFLFLPLAIGLNLIRNKPMVWVVSCVIGLSLLLHTFRPSLLASTREWFYDAYYPELFDTILPEGSAGDSISLGSSWIFYPSLTYYQRTAGLPVSGMDYYKELVIDPTLDYYFVERADTTGMHAVGFVLKKPIGPFYLFQQTHPVQLTSPNEASENSQHN
jgi:hypothetical protein